MRERLDCAVLLTRCTQEWVQPFLGQYAGGRLHVHVLDIPIDIHSNGAHMALASASMALRRYDACLLPVSPSTLSWARTSLSMAAQQLHTPVMALVRDLTAGGLYDLYDLGLADFLRAPFCEHEARVRIERLLDGLRPGAKAHDKVPVVADATLVDYTTTDPCLERFCENILEHDAAALEAYAVAAASRSATTRESFRDAKSKVVERFERAYITAALGRHAGNIAMAARAAQKHRRAFWALMRKHDIDAAPFRAQAALGGPACQVSRRLDVADPLLGNRSGPRPGDVISASQTLPAPGG
ncbi:MAG: hypothetical protein WCX93_06875 [Burkholderiaceae bacterium]